MQPLPDVTAVLADDHVGALAGVQHARATPSAETLIAGAARLDPETVEALRADGFALARGGGVLEEPLRPRAAVAGRVWLLTSGTTGRPKRVAHTLDSLTTVTDAQPPRRWLCPYAPGTYAWWQVVTIALRHPRQDVVFVEPDEFDDWAAIAAREGVTAASGTPTFWRQALWRAADDVASVPLEQVTLGGEPVDQAILDSLREVFPQARVSWIYASSEAGAAIAVHDGRAGFPVQWLDRDVAGRPRLSVRDGELLIASPHSADGLGGVIATGDRAEIVDGRVLITGRLSGDEINVGGSKIAASAVREVLLSHPSVLWAAVRGRKAPLVGAVVAAEIVTREPVAEADLLRWCAQRLPEYGVPRRVKFLDEIPMKATLKSDV